MNTATGVDVGTLAAALNVSARWVYRLAKKPGFPPRLEGKFDLEKVSMWYIRFLMAALERPRASPESAEMKAAKAGLMREQALAIELDAAIEACNRDIRRAQRAFH
jgi:hypothetical protein